MDYPIDASATDSFENMQFSSGSDIPVPDHDDHETQAVLRKSQLLYEGSLLTQTTSSLLIRSFASRYNLTVRAKRDLLQLLQLHLPKDNLLPISIHHLNKSETAAPFATEQHHYYCSKCYTPVDTSVTKTCSSCSIAIDTSFVTISIGNQIKALVESKVYIT